MTDSEIIEHFRLHSTDPDDCELVFAWDALQRLKAQPDLTPDQQETLKWLSKAVAVCLRFLHRPVSYRLKHGRPVLRPWRGPAYWRRLSTTNNEDLTN